MDFENVNVGSSANKTLIIGNSGTATLSGSISIPAGFGISAGTFNISAGGSQSFTVSFMPSSEAVYGGNLTIYSNDLGGTRNVSIQGFGYVPRPVIDIQPTSLSFVIISLGGSSNQSVIVRNTGDATLVVRGLSVTGPFSISPTSLSNIAPGGSSTVTVTFRPVVRGTASGQFLIQSANPNDSNVTDTWIVNLDGGGKAPQISISPSSFDFGSVPVGNQDFKDFTVTNGCYNSNNCGDGYSDNLFISNIVSALGDFTVSPASLTFLPGESKTFRVFFAPAANGLRSTNLTITNNDPLSSSKMVAVQGTGLTPSISLSSLSLGYGSVRVGQSASLNLTVSNTGQANLSVSFSSLPSPFSISPLSATLAPGQSRQFAVTFSPGGATNYSSQTTITSNDPRAPSLAIDVSGVGVTPDIDISPNCPDAPTVGSCQTLDFGDVSIGDQRTKQLEIKNQGTAILNVQNISTTNAAISVAPTNVTVPPGEFRAVTLSYKPQVIRNDNSTLTITSDDLDEGSKQASMLANGVSDLDLSVQKLEVTQSIQTLNQDVPLVEYKKTVVRAYIGSSVVGGTVKNITNVDGSLRVYKDGVELTSGPGIFSTDVITAYPYVADGASEPTLRSALNRTLNFLLPANSSTTKGTLLYQVEVNPISGRVPTLPRIDEFNYSNNTRSMSVTFYPRRKPQIAYIPVNYTTGSLGLAEEDLMVKNTEEFKRMYPISSFDYLRRPPITFALDIHWVGYGDGSGYYTNSGALLNALFTAESLRTFGHPAEKVIGWLPSKTYIGGFMQYPWCYECRTGIVGASRYGESAFAHELGHGYGFPHPDNYLNCDGTLDSIFPTDTGLEIFGSDLKVKARKKWADYMSYCGPRWMPVDKYLTLFNAFDPSKPVPWSKPGGGAAEASALISGYVTETGLAALYPIYEAQSFPQEITDQGPVNDYSLRALDTTGQLMWEIPLEVSFSDQAMGEDLANVPSFFAFVIPLSEDVTSVQVVKEGTVLAERKRTNAAPIISLSKPDGTPVVSTLDVLWTAEDPDGDPLQFSVLLSHDGGATFEVIGANLKQTEFHYDASQIQGSNNTAVRVIATDGMNTSVVDSPVFAVTSKPPTMVLASPKDQETFNAGSPVGFEVFVLDPEDGELPSDSIRWSSDVSGELETGLALTVDNLPLGLHLITVTAEDSDKNKVSQSVTIRIVDVS